MTCLVSSELPLRGVAVRGGLHVALGTERPLLLLRTGLCSRLVLERAVRLGTDLPLADACSAGGGAGTPNSAHLVPAALAAAPLPALRHARQVSPLSRGQTPRLRITLAGC